MHCALKRFSFLESLKLFVLFFSFLAMSSPEIATTTKTTTSSVEAATAVPLGGNKRRSTTRFLSRPSTRTSAFLPQGYSVEKGQIEKKKPRDGAQQLFWSSFVAGVGSGLLASIVCAPLDVLRTRLQVWGEMSGTAASGMTVVREIVRDEGWRGGFRGLGATLLTVPCFWGIYFPLYDDLKHKFESKHRSPSLVHCWSAVLAGAAADIICNPMFVVRTRLQTEALHGAVTPSGIVQTIKILYGEGGPLVFWRGMTASLFGLSHVAIQFPCYEFLKERARNAAPDQKETAVDLLLASGLSKMCASLLTYPHEVVRSRMMDARTTRKLMDTVQQIYAKEGLHGFYTGLHVSLIRVLPNCCITFLSYELLLRWSRRHMHENTEQQNDENNRTVRNR
jgi:solute carrier family 25 folate transporter 32